MAEWRLGRGWSEVELRERLSALASVGLNFDEPVDLLPHQEGWRSYYSEAIIARVSPGLPAAAGAFERARTAVANYLFSDTEIVLAHFDPQSELLGRRILLEMRALRVLHYLGGVVIGAVREEQNEDRTLFGFRYETLEGHIEKGAEWFVLTKHHASGEIRFRIEAVWQPGQFPNWWSRMGFALLGGHYQKRWHRRAHAALAAIARGAELERESSSARHLTHAAPEVVFKRSEVRNA